MFSIYGILIIVFSAALLSFMVYHILPKLVNFIALLSIVAIGFIIWNLPISSSIHFTLGKFNIVWANNTYSQLFAYLILVLGFFSLLYSYEFMKSKDRLGYFYMNFLFTIGGMFGIIYSQDLISLFFFWEIMTWSSFLMVIYCCKEAQKIGLKYFVFSAIGAYAILLAIILFYVNLNSVNLNFIFNNFSYLSTSLQISTIALLLIGFGVKSGLMPLHVWAPDSYSTAPISFTALFSGALSKMGIFGIGLVVLKLASQSGFYEYVKYSLAWLGALTALFATFYAIFQTDAKKLLAYSSVGQLGYIITGLAIGTPLSIMAALFLAILHGAFKATLFMATGAVLHRTGSTDMNEVTGLIRKMPFTFLAALMGIIAVSGVPPLGGFAAKWMLYQSLIESNHYLLVIVIFAASTAAFLYLYRFIFSLFLGQEEKEYSDVKEVPWTMRIPMLVLAIFTLIVGIMPGLLLQPISSAMNYLGIESTEFTTSVVFNIWGNEIDMFTIINTIGTIFIIAATFITLKGFKKVRYVTTKDIHTSGEIPTENENLTYAVDFYKPFERALGKVLKPSVDKFYKIVSDTLEDLFDHLRYIYTGNGQTYAMYVILFLVILIVFSGMIFGVKL